MLKRILSTIILVISLAIPAIADPLSAPSGQVMLTVSGQIMSKNEGDTARFDRAMLEGLEWRTVRTFTSFTEGEQEFSGPTLRSVLAAVGAHGAELRATAINDYSVSIPMEHADAHDVLLAMDRNGKPMRIRDKGPIWVVYPLDEKTAATQKFDSEMIWQLDRILVR